MSNVLANAAKDQHNVRCLLRRAIQETRRKNSICSAIGFLKNCNLLCKPSHVDGRRDFAMSMYFDSMQMHEEEFLINQEGDFDDNRSFERPKFPIAILRIFSQ